MTDVLKSEMVVPGVVPKEFARCVVESFELKARSLGYADSFISGSLWLRENINLAIGAK